MVVSQANGNLVDREEKKPNLLAILRRLRFFLIFIYLLVVCGTHRISIAFNRRHRT